MRHLPTVLLVLLGAAALDAPAADPERILAEDRAAWAEIDTVEEDYAAPPKAWTRVEDRDFGITLSFPCRPERKAQKVEERTIVQYLCTVEQRGYMAQFEQNELDTALKKLGFLVSGPASIADSLRASDLEVEVVPVKHVIYADARGRQSRIEAEPVEMELRMLIRPGTLIMLGVRDVPGTLPGDLEQFFDSLAFQ